MATYVGPGSLRWEFTAPGALKLGDKLSWDVTFRVKAGCNPIPNCVTADGQDPTGVPVHDETCVEIATTAPEPGLRVTKRLAAPESLPGVGQVFRFEIVVQNTGNNTLDTVPLEDNWDPGCIVFRLAYPAPDVVDAAGGHLHWNNVGPLAPGASAVISVFFGGKMLCAHTANCARAWWEVAGVVRLDAMDCAEIAVSAGVQKYYLPIVMKQFVAPGPTHTPTRTAAPARSATPTRTATRASVSPTRTPTATSAGTLIFSDDFDDGDLAGWTANGGTWTNPGTYMRGQAATTAWNMRSNTGSSITYEGTVNILSGNIAGLAFRSSANGSTGYELLLDISTSKLSFRRQPGGEELGGAIFSVPLEHNHQYALKVVANGSTLDGYLDGYHHLSLTDTTYSTGRLGVVVENATVAFENLKATTP
jgi:uncharacterized repeat protein (TIGR01451 family)